MNNKKFLFIPIILMLLMIIISSASAGELNTAEDLTINEDLSIDNGDSINLDEELEENAILTENEELEETQSDNSKETLSDSNSIIVTDKTFSGIQRAIDNANEENTIYLDGYYVNDLENQSIVINKTITFFGINNATVDHTNNLNYAKSIFYIVAEGVMFNDITFQNGNAENNGSAIYSECDLSIDNCYFLSNFCFSDDRSGGGALFCKKDLNINNSFFRNNSAISYGRNSGTSGGAIYGDAIYLENCIFINNYVLNSERTDYCSGGAISCKDITIKNSSFENNTAHTSAGAISCTNITVNNSSFVNNKAIKYDSGAISVGWDIFVNNCSFINNSAGAYGGGAFTTYNKLGNITNSYFEGNSGDYGGACYLSGTDHVNESNIVNCSFVDNHAAYGGAIRCIWFPNLNILNCTFEDCYSDGNESGGAILAIGSSGSLQDCNFINCSAKFLESGGAVMANCSNISVEKCNFINCYSEDICSGGAIYIYNSSLNISDSNFTECNSDKESSAGAINLNNNFTNNISTNITNCNFIGCSAINGGAVYCLAGNGTIVNCTFKNNTCSNSAGAIYIGEETSNLKISFCDFLFNYVLNDEVGNYRFGGAIYCLANKTTVANCTFTNNTAQDAGGAIFVSKNVQSMSITGSKFYNNTVINNYNGITRGGGAICSVSNGLFITKCIFSSNLAQRSWGGAVRFIFETINGNTGTKNLLSSSTLSETTISTSIEDSIFQNNDALEGKAIHTEDGAALILNTFMIHPNENLEDIVYGIDLSDSERYNIYTQAKFNSCINVTNLTFVFGEDLIVPILSENLTNVNVSIYDENNQLVLNRIEVPNGQFVLPDLSAGEYTLTYDSILDEDMFNPSSAESKLTISKAKSTVSSSAVSTYYGKTFSIKPSSDNATSIKYVIKNSAGKQVKSGSISPGASITGLSFAPGTYTLTLTAVVDGNHTGSSASSKITVNKATGNITASALTTYYNSGKTWSITLKDKTNGKVLASKKLTLKVYTGSKYKTYTVTTNSKGVATFKASTLAPGSHKVVVSYSNSNYTTKSLTKTLKINKMTLSYKVSKSTQKDGAGLHIWVKNKATGKLINKIKIKLLVYTGKKYKTITLVSAKYSSKGNGYTGYAVKGPVYSVGTHTVKIMAGDSYHTGSVKSSLVLKSTVKKYSKKTIIISKGKRTVK